MAGLTFGVCLLYTAWVSTTLENEAIATVENEATQTDWRGDLSGRLGIDPQAVCSLRLPQAQIARQFGDVCIAA